MIVKFNILISDIDGYYLINQENMPGYLLDVFGGMIPMERMAVKDYLPTIWSQEFIIDSQDITVKDLQNRIFREMELEGHYDYLNIGILHFLFHGDLVNTTDSDMRLGDILTNCKHSSDEELYVFWIFSIYQGDVFRDGNIHYYMHSNEDNHNKPHVHVLVDGGNYDASICLLDGSILAGKLPSGSKGRKIKNTIIDRQEEFFDFWNKHTNGITVDINNSLGILKNKISIP